LAFGGRQASAGVMYAATGDNSSPYSGVLNGIPGAGGSITDSAADFFSSVSSTGSVGATSTGPFFKTYCLDLFQGIMPKIVDLADVSATAGTATDSRGFAINIGAAGWVINNYGVTLGVINTSPAWAALEAAAGVNPANVTYLEQVAVTQVAVWAKEYGATSASITGSEGGTTNPDANALLTQLLALADSHTSTIDFIGYPPTNPIAGAFNNQDQGFTPLTATPEPTSVVLLGLGAVGVLGFAWKRRKRS
jgi:hypothetical protein